MQTTTYRLTFTPRDPNITPIECYAPTTHRNIREAWDAAYNDADAYTIDENDTDAAHAYLWAQHEMIRHRDTANGILHVHVCVTTGNNQRHIGTYSIRPLTIGDWTDCTICGDFRGAVTDIAADGSDYIATCETCDDDYRNTYPDDATDAMKQGASRADEKGAENA